MDFHKQYLKAIISEQTELMGGMNYFYPEFIPVTQTAYNTFYYVQGICNYTISYPYCFEIKNLNSYYILYTTLGQGQLYYDNTIYKLRPDSFVFIDCQNYHRIEVSNISSWSFYGVYINGSNTSQYYRLYSEDKSVLCPASSLSTVYRTIQRLCEHQQSKTDQRELVNSKIITDLLTGILLDKTQHHEKTTPIPDYILSIKELFDNNYSKNFTLDSLSKEFGISKYKLAREFTYFISVSPINYLINLRISAAKDLLWQTDKSVCEISESVGIENVSHFINLFKKYIGLTPMLFRKQKPSNSIYYTID